MEILIELDLAVQVDGSTVVGQQPRRALRTGVDANVMEFQQRRPGDTDAMPLRGLAGADLDILQPISGWM